MSLVVRCVKILVLVMFLFAGSLWAQHNRQGLMQPNYDDYNLKFWVRQMTVVHKYPSGNDINFQETYRFDSVGNLVEYRKRGFGGEQVTRYPLTLEQISTKRKYTFDYDGDVVELLQYDMRGTLYSSTHCIYGKAGKLVMSIEYSYSADSAKVTKRTVSEYDRNERLATVRQYTADELLLWSEKRKYDRRGNLVKRVQTFYNDDNTESTVERRTYTFDSHGNWLECKYSLNGKEMYTIIRSFDYYGTGS